MPVQHPTGRLAEHPNGRLAEHPTHGSALLNIPNGRLAEHPTHGSGWFRSIPTYINGRLSFKIPPTAVGG